MTNQDVQNNAEKVVDIKATNKNITFKDFLEKVKVDVVGFDTSEEMQDLADEEDGLIHFAVSKDTKKSIYKKMKEMEVLPLVVLGMKVELSIYRNQKIVLNYEEEDFKELWR